MYTMQSLKHSFDDSFNAEQEEYAVAEATAAAAVNCAMTASLSKPVPEYKFWRLGILNDALQEGIEPLNPLIYLLSHKKDSPWNQRKSLALEVWR